MQSRTLQRTSRSSSGIPLHHHSPRKPLEESIIASLHQGRTNLCHFWASRYRKKSWHSRDSPNRTRLYLSLLPLLMYELEILCCRNSSPLIHRAVIRRFILHDSTVYCCSLQSELIFKNSSLCRASLTFPDKLRSCFLASVVALLRFRRRCTYRVLGEEIAAHFPSSNSCSPVKCWFTDLLSRSRRLIFSLSVFKW